MQVRCSASFAGTDLLSQAKVFKPQAVLTKGPDLPYKFPFVDIPFSTGHFNHSWSVNTSTHTLTASTCTALNLQWIFSKPRVIVNPKLILKTLLSKFPKIMNHLLWGVCFWSIVAKIADIDIYIRGFSSNIGIREGRPWARAIRRAFV